jgi:hypothetical protein
MHREDVVGGRREQRGEKIGIAVKSKIRKIIQGG